MEMMGRLFRYGFLWNILWVFGQVLLSMINSGGLLVGGVKIIFCCLLVYEVGKIIIGW